MLFKPEPKDNAATETVPKPSFLKRVLRRMVSLTVTLVILGGLGYIGWYAFQPKTGAGGLRSVQIRFKEHRPVFPSWAPSRPPAPDTG